ncbi:hypothetical protein QFC21_006093 [Naganishia friedmannii]|uniref:Uncharacterized protein n=1 Tax=Naganishia friedmannii TaxID=89922 RepID=A0ACC2V4T5_9TREE|nr:hypothetical protein QFC21_006093 [Naganishia friedmannii]
MFCSPSRSRDIDDNNSEKKKRKYSRQDILFTIGLFSLPSIAIFLQLFTFISGPGTRYWTVIVHTEKFGVVKVGALGVCPERGPCKSGFGYTTGPSLGSIIPRFAAAGVVHFTATFIHFFRLKSLHKDREKGNRWTWLVWAIPAVSSLFLLICIAVDWSLIYALKRDRILIRTKEGGPVDKAVEVGGCVGLTLAPLTLVLIWFCVSFLSWRNSLKNLQEREVVETKGYTKKLQERATHKQNGLMNGYGWFAGGGGVGGATSQDAEKRQAAAGGGVGGMISNMLGGWGSDPNGAPKGSAYV